MIILAFISNSLRGIAMTTNELDKKLYKSKKNILIHDFDAFYLKIADENKYIVISLSLKAFSNNSNNYMFRPYIPILHLNKPYSLEHAKEKACEYITYLQTSIN